MSDEVRYAHLNMDNQCYTTKDRLLDYASSFKGGTWRTVAADWRGPILTAYGTKKFVAIDVALLDKRLQSRTT
jgi:hypothetical protein